MAYCSIHHVSSYHYYNRHHIYILDRTETPASTSSPRLQPISKQITIPSGTPFTISSPTQKPLYTPVTIEPSNDAPTTIQPTRNQTMKQCITSNIELYNSVREYVKGSDSIQKMYGTMSDWCFTSGVTSFEGLFYDNDTNTGNVFANFNEYLSEWDTSNIVNMNSMFNRAYAFNEDISQWDTSNVVDMSSMFKSASAFNSDISKWNTSNVVDMRFMFYNASAFNSSISQWNTSNVVDMGFMFAFANAFNSDISQWDTPMLLI
jgi:surface protein